MPVPQATLRRLVLEAIDRAAPEAVHVERIYRAVESRVRFDEADLLPPMLHGSRVKEPAWKRNVRNVLQAEKDGLRLANVGPGLWRRATPLSEYVAVPEASVEKVLEAARAAAAGGFTARDPVTGIRYVLERAGPSGIRVFNTATGKPTEMTATDFRKGLARFNAAGGSTGRGTLHKSLAKETMLVALHPKLAWSGDGRTIGLRTGPAESSPRIEAAVAAGEEDAFEPPGDDDQRTRVVRQVARRQGQPGFRLRLLEAYRSACCFTGTTVPDCLQAAHIMPYRGPEFNHVQNGLLLRADVHTLFDLGLLGVEAPTRRIHASVELAGSEYEKLSGQLTRPPMRREQAPNPKALDWHWQNVFQGAVDPVF